MPPDLEWLRWVNLVLVAVVGPTIWVIRTTRRLGVPIDASWMVPICLAVVAAAIGLTL
jgi:hypothetical protein